SGNLFTAGAINPSSDRGLKADFNAINPRSILDRLASIPIQSWRYRSDPETVRHLGPVAQDFRAAFDLGADDKTIATVDADGVALASIQALYQMMREKERQIEALTHKLDEQQAQLDRVRRALRRRRAAKRD
ncbi:MAG TPA: tail fiber domain-containing protein, partial [Pyrinomonadaceae bacterium]|nr:tail fiber domain-containing protein [Pyrinomonadaceae bacterium]